MCVGFATGALSQDAWLWVDPPDGNRDFLHPTRSAEVRHKTDQTEWAKHGSSGAGDAVSMSGPIAIQAVRLGQVQRLLV